jgi:hypothetical protein
MAAPRTRWLRPLVEIVEPPLPNVFHMALKEVSQLLRRGAKRNPEPEFSQIDLRPRPFLLGAHHPPAAANSRL